MPSRLLSLQSNDNVLICVTLWVGSGRKECETTRSQNYATPSYCWGGEQKLHLSAASEERLKRGICVSSLPKTLEDAVRVAWEFGLRLVRIDNLCIKQDDPFDLDLEIAQMPAFYENLIITLSAARATKCQEGFMRPSSLPPPNIAAFKLPYACPDKYLRSVYLLRTQITSPINKRAWTLQEYLFSPRVIQFTDFGFDWTCRKSSEFHNNNIQSLPGLYARRNSNMCCMYLGYNSKYYACRDWMNIIAEYMNRRLTFSTERLKAISGIAEIWGRNSGDSYAVGLWESYLPLGLLWTSGQPHHQPASPYIAPSWSWSDLVGQIDYFDHLHTKIDHKLKVLSLSTEPMYQQASRGSVRSGSLKILGRLQEGLISTPELDSSISSPILTSSNVLNLLLLSSEISSAVRARIVGTPSFTVCRCAVLTKTLKLVRLDLFLVIMGIIIDELELSFSGVRRRKLHGNYGFRKAHFKT